MTIRETIEEAIRFEDYTGKYIAKSVEIPEPTLSRFLSGTRGIQFDYFERLCEFLQLRLSRTIENFDAYFKARWEDGGPELARSQLEDEKDDAWEQYVDENWEPEGPEFEEFATCQWKVYALKEWPEYAECNDLDITDPDEVELWKSQEYCQWKEELHEDWEEQAKQEWEESEYDDWSHAFDDKLEDEEYLLDWFRQTHLEELQSQSWIHIGSVKHE